MRVHGRDGHESRSWAWRGAPGCRGAHLRGRRVRLRDHLGGPAPLRLAASCVARALPRRPARTARTRGARLPPDARGATVRRRRRLRVDRSGRQRLQIGRSSQHRDAELRLPLDRARGGEDDLVGGARGATSVRVVPRAGAAGIRARSVGSRSVAVRGAAAEGGDESAPAPGEPVRVRRVQRRAAAVDARRVARGRRGRSCTL